MHCNIIKLSLVYTLPYLFWFLSIVIKQRLNLIKIWTKLNLELIIKMFSDNEIEEPNDKVCRERQLDQLYETNLAAYQKVWINRGANVYEMKYIRKHFQHLHQLLPKTAGDLVRFVIDASMSESHKHSMTENDFASSDGQIQRSETYSILRERHQQEFALVAAAYKLAWKRHGSKPYEVRRLMNNFEELYKKLPNIANDLVVILTRNFDIVMM